MIMYLFSGLNKGRPVIVVAPNMDNAQQMVDASVELSVIGKLSINRNFVEVQGEFDTLKVYEATK